jgi:hypothetical protein
VKNLAKLALFFSLAYIVIFLFSTGFRFLALRVAWVRTLPQKPESFFTAIIAAACWALALALYSSILLSLSYASRGHYSIIMTVTCLFILSVSFNFGFSMILERLATAESAISGGKPIGENGLILSNTMNKNEKTIVLLQGATEPFGPHVTAEPNRPLVFQEAVAADPALKLPPVPFEADNPWFMKSIVNDLRLSGEQLQRRYNDGYFSFLIYAGALICFLISLNFIFKFSVWPLANLFIGALAFRGILSIETFLNSSDIQDTFGSFLGNQIPLMLAVPAIFAVFGVLAHIYAILVYIAKRRDDDDD